MEIVNNIQEMTEREQIGIIAADYFKFFKWAWECISNERPVWNWHISKIAYELQKIAGFVIDRKPVPYDLIINIPPGMTKSTLVTQVFPVWCWLHDPSLCFIISSYSVDASLDHSLKSKMILQSDEFLYFQEHWFKPEFGNELTLRKDTERYWINNFGGFYFTTSTGGTVTSKHSHFIIRDDSLNPKQAESDADRKTCNQFNDTTLATRKKSKDGTPTITVMQRLHDDDPTGHDLNKPNKRIRHICLPAELNKNVKPADWAKYYRDGLLDPVRLPKSVIEDIKIDLGGSAYAKQFDQLTASAEGGKIKREWFEYCKGSQLPPGLIKDLWIDGAYTKSRDNDPTGLMVAGYSEVDNKLYIIHATDDYLEMPELLKLIPEYCEQTGVNETTSRIRIEPKATGLTLKQLLNSDTNLNAVSIKSHLVNEGKEARIQMASPKVQSSRVVLVEGSWNQHFVDQLATFPNALHDEFVDLLGYAVDFYFLKKKSRTEPETKPVSKESLGFY